MSGELRADHPKTGADQGDPVDIAVNKSVDDDLTPGIMGTTGEAGSAAGGAEGAEAVRAALERAKAAAASRGVRPGTGAVPRGSGLRRRRIAGEPRRSGPGPDARDPQSVAANINRLVTERGWRTAVAVGAVIGRWDTVVGSDIAAHCRPDSFVDGVLTLRADSSAWATQVRLLMPALLRRLAEEVGEGTVRQVVVRGPSAPSWRRGPRVAPGSQGPRDTYG